MKNVTLNSEKLKRDNYDAVDVAGVSVPLGSEVELTEDQYRWLEEHKSALAEQFGVSVETAKDATR